MKNILLGTLKVIGLILAASIYFSLLVYIPFMLLYIPFIGFGLAIVAFIILMVLPAIIYYVIEEFFL